MTTIINLFGGSGVGKSTIAALLFAHMKMGGCHMAGLGLGPEPGPLTEVDTWP